jgi:hypothetical protein
MRPAVRRGRAWEPLDAVQRPGASAADPVYVASPNSAVVVRDGFPRLVQQRRDRSSSCLGQDHTDVVRGERPGRGKSEFAQTSLDLSRPRAQNRLAPGPNAEIGGNQLPCGHPFKFERRWRSGRRKWVKGRSRLRLRDCRSASLLMEVPGAAALTAVSRSGNTWGVGIPAPGTRGLASQNWAGGGGRRDVSRLAAGGAVTPPTAVKASVRKPIPPLDERLDSQPVRAGR